MIETPSSRSATQDGPSTGRAGAVPPRNRDCDICVVGDDVAGLAIAAGLARRGRDVICLTFPPAPGLGLDGVLSPGFALPTADLVERVGRADAQELLILSALAVERGLALAHDAGVALGPRGRLAVARPHAAGDLEREHVLRQDLVPDTTVLVEGEDVAALLGTSAFALGLGVVPAERVAPDALLQALRTMAEAGGVQMMPIEGALAADLRGVRKYLSSGRWRVRAFEVVISGREAFARLGPQIAPFGRAPWVAGAFHLPGLEVPYAGMVEEIGLTGLRYHFDGPRLMLAAATATPVMTRVGAARVLRRHAAELYPAQGHLVEGAHGCLLAETAGMPQIYEGERGVWYALAASADALGQGFLAARLICGAIAEKDDRIALLQPFAAPPLRGWAGRAARFTAYWHVRLAARLHKDREALEDLPPAAVPAEVPVAMEPRPRRGVGATSRHAARAALHAASGWASQIATRAAARPNRRPGRLQEVEEEAPQRP